MQVNSIRNYNSNANFRGKILPSPALDRLKMGLSDSDRVLFEHYNQMIESVDDRKQYVYKYLADNEKLGYAGIHEQKQGITNPYPLLFGRIESSIALFKELAEKTLNKF